MTQLIYSEEELMRSHDYARPQTIGGRLVHGGFDASGRYLSPRTLVRSPAIEAWSEALRARGGELLEADSSLLAGARYPSAAQQKLLLQEGLGQTFWNNLTITGKIEARGRALADIQFPAFQDVIEEDVSAMAVGHLNKGLLKAHGIDEGGEPEKGIGGHDQMWFALRDLAFGETDYPDAQPPDRIGRDPDPRERSTTGVDPRYEEVLGFLLNLLMIEFRAEIGFAFVEQVLRDPELFTARRGEAEEAAEVVTRIRLDEEVHVRSLRLYLGEMRSLTFKTTDGGRVAGAEIVDPRWQRIVQWAVHEQPKLQVEQQRELLRERILAYAEDGARILDAFNALEEAA